MDIVIVILLIIIAIELAAIWSQNSCLWAELKQRRRRRGH